MRVLFFGSSQFSCHVLAALLDSQCELAAVVTQPDQPAGRRMQLRPTPVAELAQGAGIEVLKPAKLRRRAELDALRALKPDALAVASYGKIIPPALLELTPWPLNVHPSPLPLLRGPSPLRTALLQGWDRTEVCIMSMTERIDDGPVALREQLSIQPEWNHAQLEGAAGRLGGAALVQALTAARSGELALVEQEHTNATFTRVHTRADSWIDWTRPAGELSAFVRAWDPDVGALTTYRSGGDVRRLKVWRAEVAEGSDAHGIPAGTIATATKHELLVRSGSGMLRLLEVQPESRQRMPADSFLAGGQLAAGQLLGQDSVV